MSFESSSDFALTLDKNDPLQEFKHKFHLPLDENDKPEIYFCGNSLGLQPKATKASVLFELDKWQRLGVKGHFEDQFPWMPYHEFLCEQSAELVGALPSEVVVMNSLTANLHFMMVSFFKPNKQRYKIMIEDHAFPSDHYAVESQLRHHGLDPQESLVLMRPREGEELIRTEDVLSLIDDEKDSLALILLPGVQYYTGQLFDIERIVKHAQSYDIIVGVDLAHAAGNVPLSLHDWNVDFACWCNYKYLNSGPGAVGSCFIHERHAKNTKLNRFAGWWGHNKDTRFKMQNHFEAMPTAEGWQVSNPPIISLACIKASLDVFTAAGGIHKLREKSLQLTGYLEYLLGEKLKDKISIITPEDKNSRGCQLSLSVSMEKLKGRELFEQMEASGIVTDWREPNVIRVAPVPLYNSYQEVYQFVARLEELLA